MGVRFYLTQRRKGAFVAFFVFRRKRENENESDKVGIVGFKNTLSNKKGGMVGNKGDNKGSPRHRALL
ncbi:hypothetical protein BGS_0339 [Beggiatoa sp. SS]|nr:hypothetical protein BGS_0339 [Beggiatoa sp. SS]